VTGRYTALPTNPESMAAVSILARSGDRALPQEQYWTDKRVRVSILARSGDRALRSGACVIGKMSTVSILARSGDRALLVSASDAVEQLMFQSSPGLVTGRYYRNVSSHAARYRFQSSPGLVTGRYHRADGQPMFCECVSILARSGDRALPGRVVLDGSTV